MVNSQPRGLFRGKQEQAAPGPFDSQRVFGYLTDICNIGPRYSGSEGMQKQQELIVKHFAKFDAAKVQFQPFDAVHPLTGEPVRMANIIVSWHPEAKERVLLACHYDTRPEADREILPSARNRPFIGANDGASGVAFFMEMAHHMATLKPTYGVDFVMFDGEELVYGNRGKYFLGSEFFATEYRDRPPQHRYVYGILIDMIADKNLNLYQEINSLKFAPDLVESVWETAGRMNIREFIARPKYEVQDDHLPLNNIARIPTIDIIDFDYPHWHTTRDVPANCSGASMAKVGAVLLEWLTQVPPPAR